MGKRGNRFKRQEKSKVKLKAKKNQLAKAQNVTDTSFKVRKIVVPQQLQPTDETQVQTKRKHSVKELLSRLGHHNVNMKKSALEGLMELLATHSEEVVSLYLSALLDGVAQIILDEEHELRRAAIKLIGKILSLVPGSKVKPFAHVLLGYLKCAMTHIHISIQDDSLLFLDTLLELMPAIVAANSQKILDNFLDMISCQKTGSQPGRLVTLNLGTKFTTVKWRIKVLKRLDDLMSHMKKDETKAQDNQNNLPIRLRWRSDLTNIPLYTMHYRQYCRLPGICSTGLSELSDLYEDDKLLDNYAEVLWPLLMDTWLEVTPEPHTGGGSELGVEAATVLGLIVNILHHLSGLIQNEEFYRMHRDAYVQHLFAGFPYFCIDNMNNKHKQNLYLCMLLTEFVGSDDAQHNLADRVLKYLTSCMRMWKKLQCKAEMIETMKRVIPIFQPVWNKPNKNAEGLLETTVGTYMKTKDQLVFDFLSWNIEMGDVKKLSRNSCFQAWLRYLPKLLCSPTIKMSTLKVLRKLMVMKNIYFYKTFCEQLPDILNNLGSIHVVDADSEDEGKFEIVTLLHYVRRDWSQEAIQTLAAHLQSDHWSPDLTASVNELVLNKQVSVDNLDADVTFDDLYPSYDDQIEQEV